MKRVKAHRKAWELLYGEVPKGLYVLHHCDNPSCVRPSHLFLGTAGDNRRDSAAKGRIPPPRHIGAKLDYQTACEIRKSYATGTVSQKELAHRYGVTQTTISRIVHRHHYAKEAR